MKLGPTVAARARCAASCVVPGAHHTRESGGMAAAVHVAPCAFQVGDKVRRIGGGRQNGVTATVRAIEDNEGVVANRIRVQWDTEESASASATENAVDDASAWSGWCLEKTFARVDPIASTRPSASASVVGGMLHLADTAFRRSCSCRCGRHGGNCGRNLSWTGRNDPQSCGPVLPRRNCVGGRRDTVDVEGAHEFLPSVAMHTRTRARWYAHHAASQPCTGITLHYSQRAYHTM